MKKRIIYLIFLIPIISFLFITLNNKFYQDDSFITLRYVRNIVRNNGPVFNSFERVEGYTNFLWMILLSLFAKMGISFDSLITLSQLLGVILGVLTLLFLSFFGNFSIGLSIVFTFFLVLLTGINYAFCYWAISGMETILFTLLLIGGTLFFVYRKNEKHLMLSSVLIGLSALTRPEGNFVFLLLGFGFLIQEILLKKLNLKTIMDVIKFYVFPFFLIVFPHFVFRFIYYKSFLPNTFYAKTSFNLDYLKMGLNYAGRFFMAYGLFGIILVLPLIILIIKKKFIENFVLFFVIFSYIVYIISVGGDTLQVHRFFVPILPLIILYFIIGLKNLRLNNFGNILILAFIVVYFLLNPFPGQGHKSNWKYTRYWKVLEIGLVEKMKFIGLWLNKNMKNDEIFAASTIGAISFYADKDMIDLLGLTDSVIGRHPEHIKGLQHSWRERNYNSKYVLSMLPSYIVFSTGSKPSAAAERALFLWKRFRIGYYPYYISSDDGKITEVIYKRNDKAKDIPVENIDASVDFPTKYRDAINSLKKGVNNALKSFNDLIPITPEDFGYVHAWLGQLYESMKDFENAQKFYEESLRRDEYCIMSIEGLVRIYLGIKKDPEKSYYYITEMIKKDPDYIYGYYYIVNLLRENKDKKELKEKTINFLKGINHKFASMALNYI